MQIPMLADISKQISKNYGCLWSDGSKTFRATYIIDGKGILRHMQIQDTQVGRSADEYLRLVQAFQYTDEYGEVCPASWVPGGATMHADAESKKTEEYWQNQ